jgi:hypothetical protein
MTEASRAQPKQPPRTRSRRDVSSESKLNLACWKRQREDASVRNCGEHELKGVLDLWHLYRVVS